MGSFGYFAENQTCSEATCGIMLYPPTQKIRRRSSAPGLLHSPEAINLELRGDMPKGEADLAGLDNSLYSFALIGGYCANQTPFSDMFGYLNPRTSDGSLIPRGRCQSTPPLPLDMNDDDPYGSDPGSIFHYGI